MKLSYKSAIVLVMSTLAIPSAYSAELAILRNGFSIRYDYRETRGAVTRLYLTGVPENYVEIPPDEIVRIEKIPEPPSTADSSPSHVASLEEIVSAASKRNRIDPYLAMSLIRAESGFNPKAVSPKGARGLMQLMPKTAASLGVADAMDPVANIEGGLRYLRELLALYNNDVIKALAAYNAGPKRIQQFHGVPPYPETRLYIAQMISDLNQRKLVATRRKEQ